MGWCQEFAVEIEPGCDHLMVADRHSCSCQRCGTECLGRFAGCPTVWARGPQPVSLRRHGSPPSARPAEGPAATDRRVAPLTGQKPGEWAAADRRDARVRRPGPEEELPAANRRAAPTTEQEPDEGLAASQAPPDMAATLSWPPRRDRPEPIQEPRARRDRPEPIEEPRARRDRPEPIEEPRARRDQSEPIGEPRSRRARVDPPVVEVDDVDETDDEPRSASASRRRGSRGASGHLVDLLESLRSEMVALQDKVDRLQDRASTAEDLARAAMQATLDAQQQLRRALQEQHGAIANDLARLRGHIAKEGELREQSGSLHSERDAVIDHIDARLHWLVNELSQRLVVLGNEVAGISRLVAIANEQGPGGRNGSANGRDRPGHPTGDATTAPATGAS